jgi:hypothetical protein
VFYGKIWSEAELPQRRSGTPYWEVFVLFLGIECLSDKSWDNMTLLGVILIILSIKVGGNSASEICSIAFIIKSALDLSHSLGIGISFIRWVGFPIATHL